MRAGIMPRRCHFSMVRGALYWRGDVKGVSCCYRAKDVLWCGFSQGDAAGLVSGAPLGRRGVDRMNGMNRMEEAQGVADSELGDSKGGGVGGGRAG